MIAPWMLYALAIASGAAVAALGAERALGALGRSRRWVWALSMSVSALAPAALPVWAVLSAAAPSPPAVQQAYELTSVPRVLPAAVLPEVAPELDWGALLDLALGWGWALASLAGIALLLGSAVSLHAMRERWRRRRVALPANASGRRDRRNGHGTLRYRTRWLAEHADIPDFAE